MTDEWRSTSGLFESVYEELRAVAEGYLRRERADHTLAATALVHEAFLKISDIDGSHWVDGEHFMVVAVRALRRVLATHAESRAALRRGGGVRRVDLEEEPSGFDVDPSAVLALNEALEELRALDARQARVVELRFLGGLSVEDTARVLGVSSRTVTAEWAHARAWLRSRIDHRGIRS